VLPYFEFYTPSGDVCVQKFPVESSKERGGGWSGEKEKYRRHFCRVVSPTAPISYCDTNAAPLSPLKFGYVFKLI